MFVFDNSEDLDIATYEYRIYQANQVEADPANAGYYRLIGNVSINAGTITPYRQGFNLANVFTISVENSTTTSTTSTTSAVSYYGAIRAIDTSGNAGPWTLIEKTSTDTPLIDQQFIGSLTAAKITTGTIGAAEITLNGANSIIKSSNYSAGSLGWKITGLGDAEFNDLTVRTALDIGGSDASSFHVDTNGNLWLGASTYGSAPFRISNTGNVDVGGTDASSFHIDNTGNIWSGAGTYSTAPFKVSNAGELTATSVTITNPIVTTPAITGGSITGATLDIGGLDASSFHVDANGNIWSGAGTYNPSTNLTFTGAAVPFYVTAAGAIKATSGRIGPVLISSSSMNSQGSSPYLNSNNNYYALDNFGDIYVYSNPGTDVGGPHIAGGVQQYHVTAVVGEYIEVRKSSTSAFSDALVGARMGDVAGTGFTEFSLTKASATNFMATSEGNVGLSGNLTAGGYIAAGGTGITDAGSVSTNNWFRSTGVTGWYNQTYGGGIFMQDTTWVRVYNGKNFYCPETIRAENVVQVAGIDGGLSMRSWTASANYMSLATTNMSASEYCVLSDGTNTFLSGGAGGVTYIRAGNNDTNGQIAVSSGSVTVDSIIVSGLSGIRFPAASAVYTNMPSDYNFSLNFAYSNNSYMYVLVNSDNGAVRLWSTASASDRRIKDNINENVSSHLNKFYSLKAYDFEYNDKKPFVGGTYAPTGEKEVGLIAQEVMTIFPNMVIGNEEDSYLQINYQEFCRVLIAASLDQNKRIEELSSKVEELESRLI